ARALRVDGRTVFAAAATGAELTLLFRGSIHPWHLFAGPAPGREHLHRSAVRDWTANLNWNLVPEADGPGRVSAGVRERLDALWPDVLGTLEALHAEGRTVRLAGHSLGGALAVLTARRLQG